MGDWTADLLFKPDVAAFKSCMINEKHGNHDKEKEDSVNIRKEKT